MGDLLYLMFRCDGDVMENLDFERVCFGSKHTRSRVHVPSREVAAWFHTRPAVHGALMRPSLRAVLTCLQSLIKQLRGGFDKTR